MKKNLLFSIITLIIFCLSSCEKDDILKDDHYSNNLSFPDTSDIHPKAAEYQAIIDDFVNHGGLGTSVCITDQYGTWLGTGGYADIASNIKVQPDHQFLIASTSKMFTATCIFSYIDDGILSLEDPVNKWIDKSICDQIDNANESKIKNLLGHTSGIRDIYNVKHIMKYVNKSKHHWDDKDLLEFVYGKSAYLEVDEGWTYSNVNYILLGMILEEASGKSLKQVYEEVIFTPLNLQNAHYGIGNDKAPAGLVKGYTDVNSNNKFVEADDFYEEDIGVGGDGGIAITAQELDKFLRELLNGNIISQASLDEMQNWNDIGGYSTTGKTGLGLFYEDDDEYGVTMGHPGGIIGFETGADYFEEKGVSIIFMLNTDLILTTEEYDDNFNTFYKALKKSALN